jgi:hypothetical protein
MLPNQRQLFIVVYDWGSYLGSHFPIVFVGSCLQLVACVHTSSFTFRLCVCALLFLFEFRFIKNMWNSTHAAPWSTHYDDRDIV